MMNVMNQEKQRINPLFEPYCTPHETVPFDRITLEDFEEAFMEGIRREDEQIENIINNPEKPTFENTLLAQDETRPDYYNLLSRTSAIFFNLLSANTNDEMDALAQKLSPILTKHSNDISLNRRLFGRVRYVYLHRSQLEGEERMLLENAYEGFVRSGALLNAEGKQRLRRLTEEVSMLSLQFSQNLLKENKAFVLHLTDEQQLDGLPDTAREAAAAAARERGLEGWVFTLDAPSYSPFITYSTQRHLREQLYMARNTVCTHNNAENNMDICKRLVNLRREMAQLLGYKTYAHYVMKHRMAGSVREVNRLLQQLIKAYRPTAQQEYSEVRDLAVRSERRDYQYRPWDTAFYAHKIQLQKFNIDAEMLRPYFELSRVIEGVFGLAHRLYGITFRENTAIPVYHPDVKAYEVTDEDGSFLAVFYADFFPRKGKQSGAWMTEFQGQWFERRDVHRPYGPDNRKNVRPHVSVVMNLTKPTAEKPALLTLGEVTTFLHEFGHSLHGMFANTRFESLSGTNVWWDFVELPSQFMENYAVEKEFLHTFAFHYQTGEPLPDELVDRIVRSRNFMAASACLRQVSFGLLDMAYYTQKQEFTEDIIPFEKRVWRKAIIGRQRMDTCMTTQFSHIMAGGYAAGYYSYKWAEVLDADAFAVFKRNGIFDRATARRFRDEVLSRGGTEPPMTLYKRFRGGEPTIDALLERDGISQPDTPGTREP
jgi:peptidyl-dipeptidase Dcp